FSLDETTDQIIASTTLGATLGDDQLDRVIQGTHGFHRCLLGSLGLGRVYLWPSQNGQGPSGVLFDLLRLVAGEANQRINHPDGKIQSEVHQIRLLLRNQGLNEFFPDDPVYAILFPAIDRVRHEHWLQKVAHVPVLIAVHCCKDQSVEERTQTFSDKPAGKLRSVSHYMHDVVIFEQREAWAIRIHPCYGWHPQLLHEITFHDGVGFPHL